MKTRNSVRGLLLGLLVLAPQVVAATFTANSSIDAPDNNPGDGLCRSDMLPASTCTLRAAIMEANALAGSHIINLQSGRTYTLSRAGVDNTAVNGDLDITKNLTIIGQFAETVVDGGGLDRVFAVLQGANVTIRNMTIQNGAAANGGGVLVDIGSTLTLERSSVRASVAGNDGGGIYNAQGALTLKQSTLSGNYAAYGGAIFNRGALTVQESTLFDNAAARGGALNNDGGSTAQILNSTVSGNRAADGGGLYVQSGVVTLINATVTRNRAEDGEGGGIFGAATAANTIIAGNLGAKPDCAGALTSQGYNLIGSGAGCSGPVHGLLGDQVGPAAAPIDPGLGPLQDNGAFLLTHALLPGSPALNNGNPAAANGVGSACRVTDQRGLARPGGVRCEIGAYEEVSHFTVDSHLDLGELTPGDGVCLTVLLNQTVGCTLRAAIQEANLMPGLQIIDLPAGVYTLQRMGANEDDGLTGDFNIKQDLVIRGAGAANTILAGNAIWDDRIFTTNGVVVIAGVTISGGNSSTTGGAIHTLGVLTLRDSVVSHNRSVDNGGAIFLQGRALTLDRSTLTANQSEYGGAVASSMGAITVQASTIVSNTAQYSGGAIDASNTLLSIFDSAILSNTAVTGSGGGIDAGNERLLVRNSLLSGNWAGDRGGAIHTNNTVLTVLASTISDNRGRLGGGIMPGGGQGTIDRLTNVTISGNRALDLGGGLFNNSGEILLNNVTISNNRADSDNDGQGEGGGIRTSSGASTALMNSLLAGNSSGAQGKPECSGNLTSLGYNLVQNPAGCTFGMAEGDITGQDAKLGPLQAGSGALPAHALLAGSPAIDAGAPSLNQTAPCAPYDQRGFQRTDGNGDGVVRCDIGAYEAAAGFRVLLPLVVRG